ncbi:MAG: hypothetical protein HY303_21445 [Candidatus Wallbacteria bacterium]|nr:hypothetical protein [Candidatus Wallbacteria bacterium]
MFGIALPKLIALLSPLVVPVQLMSTDPNVVTIERPHPHSEAHAKRTEESEADSRWNRRSTAPARPDERDLASLAIRIPGELGAAVIPSPAAQAHRPDATAPAKPSPVPATAKAEGEPIRGLHVTGWVALLPKRMGEMVDFIDKSQLNAVMVCIKDEAGTCFWKMKTPGQEGPHCMSKLLAQLKKRGIHSACRFVCFKDAALEKENPAMRFTEKRIPLWIDPANPKVIEHVLGELKEVAELGFEEINLDYVRFPDRVKMAMPLAKKVQYISEFIHRARETVKPYNVRLTASVFGYVAWDEKKANVGQRLEDIYKNLDGVYFMVYPSHFAKGDLGFRDPSSKPYEVVRLGMSAARHHFDKTPIDILPWIQVFSLKHDYHYGPKEVLLELKGNEDAGVAGYWAWDPGCEYRALKEALPILAKQGYPPVNEAYFAKKKENADKKQAAAAAAMAKAEAVPVHAKPAEIASAVAAPSASPAPPAPSAKPAAAVATVAAATPTAAAPVALKAVHAARSVEAARGTRKSKAASKSAATAHRPAEESLYSY